MATLPEPRRILCVDDALDIRVVVRGALERAGYAVDTAASTDEALERIRTRGLPDLAVVDLMMPGRDGFAFCREVHSFCDLPIILLTAVDDEPTTVRAIEEVAEDYVIKPFRPPELAARVGRVLKRVAPVRRPSGVWNRIDASSEVDFAGRRLRDEAGERELTPIECKILHVLWRSQGRTVGTEMLLRRVWPTGEVFEDTLRVHVHRLRRKLAPADEGSGRLVTDRGQGYRLAGEPER